MTTRGSRGGPSLRHGRLAKLHFGLNADWQAVPDLHDLAEDIPHAFREMYELI